MDLLLFQRDQARQKQWERDIEKLNEPSRHYWSVICYLTLTAAFELNLAVPQALTF